MKERKDPLALPEFDTGPWSGSVNYGFNYNAKKVAAHTFQKTLTHSFSAQLKFNPTPKWQCAYNTAYDFKKGEFSKHTFSAMFGLFHPLGLYSACPSKTVRRSRQNPDLFQLFSD